MTDETRENEEFQWSLGSFTKAEDGLSMTLLREVEEAERVMLQNAATFIRGVHGGALFGEVLAAIKDVEERLARVEPGTSQSKLRAVQHAFRLAARLVGECADRIIANLSDYPLPEPDRIALADNLQAVRERAAPISVCTAAASVEQPLVIGDGEGAPAVAVQPEIAGQTNIEPLAVLGPAALSLQLMLAHQLHGLAPAIEEASRTLRKATAEVLDGVPCLWRHRRLAEDERPDLGSVQPDDLALQLIAPLNRQVRRAKRVIEDQATARAVRPPGPGTASPPGDEERREQAKLTVDDQAVAEAESATAAREREAPLTPGAGENSGAGAWRAREQGPLVAPGVIDLRLAVERISSISDELEQAWSKGLDAAVLAEVNRNTLVELDSLLRSLAHWNTAAETRLKERGVDTSLRPDLLNLAVESLSLDPDDVVRWRQLEVALLQGIELLANQMIALRDQTHVEISFDNTTGQADRKAWWESGAFNAIRRCVQLVLRLHEQLEVVEARLLGEEPTDAEAGSVAAIRRMMISREALIAGDPESALLHLRFAYLSILAEEEGTLTEALARLDTDTAMSSFAKAARLVIEITDRLVAGDDVDLGIVMLGTLMGGRALAARLMPGLMRTESPDA